jgi:hypothetical protein
MTSTPWLDTLAGLAAVACALAVFLGAALDGPGVVADAGAAAATRGAP